MPDDLVLGERVARQGFVTRPARTVVEAVRLTTAIQAQDAAAGRLGVRPRSTGLTDAEVRHALEGERSVVKGSLLRGTIHLVAAEDLRWLTALVGPVVARSSTRRWDGLGLTSALLTRCTDALPEVLAGGPLTAREVADRLRWRGIPVPFSEPSIGMHLLLHAATLGLVCRGPDRGRETTYVLVDEWLPRAPPGPRGDEALAELARRYFTAFSPATPSDFTAWSGLPSGHAIKLIRDELTACEVYGKSGYRLGSIEPMPGTVTLPPAFDNYLLGYRERRFIAEEHRREVYVGGIIRPTVLVSGRVTGRWERKRPWTRSPACR